MTQDTFCTAYQQANAELLDLQEQFERLCHKKEQIEKVVEALKPFIELHAEGFVVDQQMPDPSIYLVHEAKDVAAEPAQPPVEAPEPVVVPVECAADLTPEPVQFAPEPSSDPFQRRIESVLWGWSQKREGMASAV